MGERVERRLAAVLAADVAGYSRLMSADEVGTLEALKGHRREVFDPAIAKHKGRIVKTTGDGMLVEFASAVDAVTCAMEVQRQMAGRNGDAALVIAFRIGINVGDIIIDGDDIFGDGVNVAARVENECELGGVCLSGNAFEQVRGKTGFVFDDLGERTLKNIDRPVRLYAARSTASLSSTNVKQPETAKPLALPNKPSIAVLPFQNMSGDPEQEYFADGMVEDIITALSRFKSLFVIARNSTFTYKGKTVDIKQVGRDLGVQYVLEGSVRRVGEKVRITTQLIDAITGSHVWAERFDGTLQDVFEMQDSVTARVVGSIAPKMDQATWKGVGRKPVENWSSYDYYLRGQSLFHQGNQGLQVQAISAARDMFRKAASIDPTFARAHAKVAQITQAIRDLFGHPISEEERTEALTCAELALRLSGDDEVVLANLVYVFGNFEGDYERGAELADRALTLNPNLSFGWNARGTMHLLLGEHENALDAFARAIRLNPIDKVAVPYSYFGIAASYLLLGRYDESTVWARKVLALQPNDVRGLLILAGSSFLSGQLSEANAAAAQIKQYYPHMRAFHLRQGYRVRKPEDMAVVERTIAFIGLPG